LTPNSLSQKSAKETYLSAAGYYTDENQDAAAMKALNNRLELFKQVGRTINFKNRC